MNYTLEMIANACGVPLNTARTWQHRGIILAGEGRGHGNVVLFSLNRAVQFALTAELVRFGIAPRRAGMMSASFTDMAEPAYMPDTAGEVRLPGALFTTGRTVLVAHEDTDIGRVVCIRPDTSAVLLFNVPGGGPRKVACMVDVGAVAAAVTAALTVRKPRALVNADSIREMESRAGLHDLEPVEVEAP